MKFYDNNGVLHNSYFGSIKSSVINKVNKFIDKKFPGANDVADMEFDSEFSMESNGIYDEEPAFACNIEDDLNDIPTIEEAIDDLKEYSSYRIHIEPDKDEIKLVSNKTGEIVKVVEVSPEMKELPIKDILKKLEDEANSTNDEKYHSHDEYM